MKSLKNYLKRAQKEKWALGQFNFCTLEQLRGILAAARKMKSPVILGTSGGESRYLGLKEAVALVEISKMKYGVEAFLNIDHGKEISWLKEAMKLGYSAVHYDGSGLSLEKNKENTKKIVSLARKEKVLVEAELGSFSGDSSFKEKNIKIREEDLTSPQAAAAFVEETRVDSLAPVIGNVHGVYKKMPRLDLPRLEEINKLTNCFLVLHGGSGLSRKELKSAIQRGVVKVNFNTELRMAWKKAIAKGVEKKEIKPYLILPKAQLAVQKKVEEKIRALGSSNKI